MSTSAFNLLDPRIQKFIWQEKWKNLRPIQEEAIPIVVQGKHDAIIAAATAAGKTEAAFFPALTHLVNHPGLLVYISPLKALINDQLGRLDLLCGQLNTPVFPWHGDVAGSIKARFVHQPQGVLLITPESLEALLCTKASQIQRMFANTRAFIIDELHAFIGSERGKQLQSLMHRIDVEIRRQIPRVGLSATLGDMHLAAQFLRPGHAHQVHILNPDSPGNTLKVLVKGFEEPCPMQTEDDEKELEAVSSAQQAVAAHMFNVLRGSNNLVFPNSRKSVELYTSLLGSLSEAANMPNEFWPHHGSLSKEIREETEAALKQKVRPATAVCTNTLELGIDIGAVKSVVQINKPPSVASVRQRLGRSGRRVGESAILRGYCIEEELTPQSILHTQLRLNTVQMAATVQLLTQAWFEPPKAQGLHLSTLVQQMLSCLTQSNGLSIGTLYNRLCSPSAPFEGLNKTDFAALVRHLGEKNLLTQDCGGALLPGHLGEHLVNDYKFYAAFASQEEYRLVAGGRHLGTLPVEQTINVGQRLLFAGKTWIVDNVDSIQNIIHLTRARKGAPPEFPLLIGPVHTKVRQQMRDVLESNHKLSFLDNTAARFIDEARLAYQTLQLANTTVLQTPHAILLFTWLGSAANEALACMLRACGIKATEEDLGLSITKEEGLTVHDVVTHLHRAATVKMPSLEELLPDASKLKKEKWDWALPDDLLRRAYASMRLDLQEAQDWASKLQP